MTYIGKNYANVLTSTKHVFPSELTFYSYQITFPRDFTYGQVAGRLSGTCLTLMSQDIAATYALTYQEGELTAELLCHKPVTQDTIQKTMNPPLTVSMGPKETRLKFADYPKPLKTLLDLWLRQKMRQLGNKRDDFLYIFHKEKNSRTICGILSDRDFAYSLSWPPKVMCFYGWILGIGSAVP